MESCQVLRWVPAEAKVSRKQATGVTQGMLLELPSSCLTQSCRINGQDHADRGSWPRGALQSQRDSTFQIATALNEQNPHPLWQAKDRKGWLQKKLKSSQPNCWFFFLVTSRVFYYQVWFHPCKQGQNPAPHSLQMKTFYYQAGLWTYISQVHCLEFHFERQIFICAWLTGFAFFRTERPRMERK